MGDVLMSGPAIRALKQTFGARITLLTSKLGSAIAPYMLEIDDVIVADLPWVRAEGALSPEAYEELTGRLRNANIDLAVIFTVYSQSALPAALLCWQAGIPERMAYCRENPYQLLTGWLPDAEPYYHILHQVERDLRLARMAGASTNDDRLRVAVAHDTNIRLTTLLAGIGIAPGTRFIILHPGVSEIKRQYPLPLWIETAGLLSRQLGLPLIVTGAPKDTGLAAAICGDKPHIHNLAGKLTMAEFIALIAASSLVISVNTITAHLAAATQTPLVVLYAMTNPQHTPWKSPAEILTFSVPEDLRSKNQVIRFVSDHEPAHREAPSPRRILESARRLLKKMPVPAE